MKKDILLLSIGASISLISTLMVFFIQILFEKIIKNQGELKIYIKKVYSKVDSQSWGCDKNGNVFFIPLWIEFQNTKEKREIIRNLNLELFLKGTRLSGMTQC